MFILFGSLDTGIIEGGVIYGLMDIGSIPKRVMSGWMVTGERHREAGFMFPDIGKNAN